MVKLGFGLLLEDEVMSRDEARVLGQPEKVSLTVPEQVFRRVELLDNARIEHHHPANEECIISWLEPDSTTALVQVQQERQQNEDEKGKVRWDVD